MPDYGFGALAIGSGAQAGLQDLIKRRLLERQMALQEQAQRENSDYRNRDLELRSQERSDALSLQEALGLASVQDRRTKMAFDAGEAVSEQTPAGADVPDAVRGTPAAARIRAIPMAGMDTEGNPAKPLEFMGFSAKEREREDAAENRRALQEDAQASRAEMLKLAASMRPPSQTGQVTPSQRFNMERTLRREWNTLSQNWRTMKGQIATMEAGMEAAKRGDKAAGAQAVLVTFQKILDPTSVVRESEYARSAEGQSILNQIKGALDRYQNGGVGVIVPELDKFYQLGKRMVEKAGAELPVVRQQFEQNAVEYGLNPRLIIAEDPADATTPEAPTQAAPTNRVYYDSDGKPIKR